MSIRKHWTVAILFAANLAGQASQAHGAVVQADATEGPAALCRDAIRAAETTYGLPPGLLGAIGEVESGRVDAATGRLEPWPWTVQAGDQSWYFATKQEAVQWVRDATLRGVTSIDAGCLQVNLFYHPRAFGTLDDAFDAARNVDYAARFLLRLHDMTGDWRRATGFYHSQTGTLAASYELRVERRLNGVTPPWPRAVKLPTELLRLASAWQATMAPPDALPPPAESNWSVLLHEPPGAATTRHLHVNTK